MTYRCPGQAFVLIIVAVLSLTGCFLFGDDELHEQPLTKGFALSWYIAPREQMLLLKTSSNGGIVIVDKTVAAAGWNEDFILAMQHANVAGLDSLRPYERITNYFVIDLRKFEEGDRDGYEVHQAVGDTAFHSLRSTLGVPEHLQFTVVDSTLR